jgi:competence ComEA-like helix-hairpin-helix protein
MKFPFFRPTKPELARVAKVIPAPKQSGDTQRLKFDREVDAAKPAVSLALSSVLAQIPSNLFAPGAQPRLQKLQVALPAEWVLPQLTSGRCIVPLTDLISLLPQDLLQRASSAGLEKETVALPLDEVIAALSPDLLQTKNEKVIDINAPEFNELPALFDDEFMQRAEAAAEAEAAPAPEPLTVAPPPSPAVVAEVAGQSVLVSLRSLVAVLPEVVFCCARVDLSRRADLNARVPLPLAPILPQLNTGRVRLPVETVLRVLPAQLLANPLPALRDETVTLPLGEIVPQLPPQLFQEFTGGTPQEVVSLDDEIPTPFQEKVPAIEPEYQPAPAPQMPVVEPPVPTEATSAEVPEEALADDSFAVFAEKPAAPVVPPVPVAPYVPEPMEEEIPENIFAERVAPPVAPVPPVAPAPVAAVPPEVVEPEPVSVLGEAAEAPVVFDERKCLININRCTVDDLLTIEGVGPALARRIIEFREKRGQFRTLEELHEIPGVGRKTFKALVGSEPRSLNQLLGAPVNRELTLPEVVRYAAALPGVSGCVLAMSNGLFVTGEVPAEFDRTAMSVFAPQLFRKIGRYTKELKVGQVQRMTIFTDRQPLSIFQAGEVYLVIVHDNRHFSKALLRRLERISRGLAALCRNRAVM